MKRRASALWLVCLLVSGCREITSGVAVGSIRFAGAAAFDENRLKAIIATRESGRLPWSKPQPFDERILQVDLERITAFYIDRGYPHARVLSYRADLNAEKDRVAITITVSEGQPIMLEDVRFFGFEVLPPRVFHTLRENLGLALGQPRDQALVRAARERAAQTLHDHGYPFGVVEALEAPGTSPIRAAITVAADPGPSAVFGPVDVRGVLAVSADVVQRQLTFQSGETFRARLLVESQRLLYGLELFTFVNVDAQLDRSSPTAAAQPVAVPIRVSVVEGKHRRVRGKAGYGSEERARGELRWSHVNFFGGARTGSVEGKWSSLDRGVRLSFTEPFFFRPKYSLSASGQRWFADEPAFELDTRGYRATVTRQSVSRNAAAGGTATTTASLSLINEYEKYQISNDALQDLSFRDELIALGLDPRLGFGRGRLSALAVDLQRSTVENLLDSRAGYIASLHIERAGGGALRGDFDYWETHAEGRHYLTIARRAVVAARLRVGVIDAHGDVESQVPFFKRYFLGGSTSLRGWGRYQVSPLSGAGLPIGGFSFLDASAEARFPIVNNFSGVVFIDAGNAWRGSWDITLGDLVAAVGPGVRYATPIGPLRFDFAYQLTPIEGLLVNGRPEERRWRVHFSIGQTF